MKSLEATQDNYPQILKMVVSAVEVGGQAIAVVSAEDQTKATADERKLAQNNLMWAWNNEILKRLGGSAKFIHGERKLNVLLPMYKSWGGASLTRANFIQSVLDRVPLYEHKVGIAYDMVRTKNLSIKRMAEYLTEYKKEAALMGVELESNEDLEFKSLMTYAGME